MRIIAGRFRGRVLYSPKKSRVRPTADRVKEAWMSILQNEIADSRVLDLFAGSGSLGLEALSRGARSVDFVDQSRASVEIIRKNIELLDVGAHCTIFVRDALKFLGGLESEMYDLAFADPPFSSTHAAELVELFGSRPFARVLGVEHSAATQIAGDRTVKYGDIAVTFCYAS